MKYLTLILLTIIAVLSGALLYIILNDQNDDASRDRDITRLSDVSQIRDALEDYQERHGYYPPCLYKKASCTSLEGSSFLPIVPVDPLTNLQYSYSAIGRGVACTSYHLGSSLERKRSQSLLTGSDAPPVESSNVCRGSAPDFSGLSFAAGGQSCGLIPGIAQPSDEPTGETCYDIKPK